MRAARAVGGTIPLAALDAAIRAQEAADADAEMLAAIRTYVERLSGGTPTTLSLAACPPP